MMGITELLDQYKVEWKESGASQSLSPEFSESMRLGAAYGLFLYHELCGGETTTFADAKKRCDGIISWYTQSLPLFTAIEPFKAEIHGAEEFIQRVEAVGQCIEQYRERSRALQGFIEGRGTELSAYIDEICSPLGSCGTERESSATTAAAI